MRYIALFCVSLLILGIIPAFAVYQPPTSQEKDTFEQLLDQFNKVNVPKKDVTNVISTFQKPLTTTFTCDKNDRNNLVVAIVNTRLAAFDQNTTHKDIVTGGTYTWQCLITTQEGKITLNCNNELRLNPSIISNNTGISFQLHKIENLVILYHELLHGQLMIDAIKNSSIWNDEICNIQSNEAVDYSYADSDHKIINPLQTQFATDLVIKAGGQMITKEVTPSYTKNGKFTIKVLSLINYPEFENGAKITMQATNIDNTSFSTIKNDVFLYGQLVNKTKSGTVWFFLFKDEQNQTKIGYELIPSWIKRSAGIWSSEKGNVTDLYPVIHYLVEQNMIVLNDNEDSITIVPHWLKKNALWWFTGIIDDKTFVDSLQYLISTGIIF